MLRALLTRLLPTRPSDATAVVASAATGPDALVQVYQRAERYYIEASDRTRYAEAGYWIATGVVTVLAGDATDVALGGAVLEALARSRVEVPVPPRDAKLEAGLFRAMGVRSRRAAMTGTRSCLVGREPPPRPGAVAVAGAAGTPPGAPAHPGGHLRIEALHNGGSRGDGRGYHGLRAAHERAATEAVTAVPLGGATAAAVGAAVRRALQHATLVT